MKQKSLETRTTGAENKKGKEGRNRCEVKDPWKLMQRAELGLGLGLLGANWPGAGCHSPAKLLAQDADLFPKACGALLSCLHTALQFGILPS
jgi:hypothetical protein